MRIYLDRTDTCVVCTVRMSRNGLINSTMRHSFEPKSRREINHRRRQNGNSVVKRALKLVLIANETDS